MADGKAPAGAIDLGGTKIYSAIVDAAGRTLGADLRPTDADEGVESVLERLVESLAAAAAVAGVDMAALAGVGIAAPGPVNVETGHIVNPPNLPGWADVAIGSLLAGRMALPVIVENDANAAAVGEYAAGAGRAARALLYVTAGTGIGGGIVLDGRLYRGPGGAAGEIGHMRLVPDGPRCGCGRLGCLEAIASGTALARDARASLAAGRATILRRLTEETGAEVNAEIVARAAAAGDADAAGLIGRAGTALGVGLGSAVNLLNPDVIVLGGGLTEIGAPFLGPVKAALEQTIFAANARRVELRKALLDNPAAVGAAELVRLSLPA